MATKNIVPNDNGEGGIGVTGKRWNTGFINTITGNLTGNVTGNVSGTAATVTGAAQSNITSLGTLTSLSISGDLTVSGGDVTLGAAATAGTLSLVASAHGAVGNSLTISGGSTTAGTTDDIAGGSLILTGGAGKGTGDGGSVIIKSATKGTSGSSLNAINDTIVTFASDLSTTFAGNAIIGSQAFPAFHSNRDVLLLGQRGNLNAIDSSGNIYLNNNIYVDGSGNDKSVVAGGASQIRLADNEILMYTSNVASAANETITLTPRLAIESDGVIVSSSGIEFEGTALATGQSGISSSGNGGEIRIYTNGNQAFTFGAAGAGGNLVVENGDIATSADDKGFVFGANGDVTLKHEHNKGVILKNTVADAAVLTFQTSKTAIASENAIGKMQFQAPDESDGSDAITVGAEIKVQAAEAFGADAGGMDIVFGTKPTGNSASLTNRVIVKSNGNVTIEDGDLVVASGHGIDFGAAKAYDAGDSSTVLDDYEEGLYTPSFTPQTNGSITLSGALNEFSYTKVGRLVTIVGKAEVTSVSSPQGIVRLSIPIAVGSLSGKAADFAGSIIVAEGANNATTTFAMFGSEGNSYVEIYEGDTTSLASNVGQEFQANTLVWISMTYVGA